MTVSPKLAATPVVLNKMKMWHLKEKGKIIFQGESGNLTTLTENEAKTLVTLIKHGMK